MVWRLAEIGILGRCYRNKQKQNGIGRVICKAKNGRSVRELEIYVTPLPVSFTPQVPIRCNDSLNTFITSSKHFPLGSVADVLETVSFEQDSETMPMGAENLEQPKVFRFSLGQFQRGDAERMLIVGR